MTAATSTLLTTLKMATIFLYIASCAIYMTTPLCSQTPTAMHILFPTVIGSSALLLLLLQGSNAFLDCSGRHWTQLELLFNMSDFMLVLGVAIVNITQCNGGAQTLITQQLTGPLAIVGALLLASSSIIWYVQRRATIEQELNNENRVNAAAQARKSIYI